MVERSAGVVRNLVVRNLANKERLMTIPGFCEDMVKMLHTSTHFGQQHAAGCVMALAMEKKYQADMLDVGAMRLMIGLVDSPNLVTRTQVLAALWNFCRDDKDHCEMVSTGTLLFIPVLHPGKALIIMTMYYSSLRAISPDCLNTITFGIQVSSSCTSNLRDSQSCS